MQCPICGQEVQKLVKAEIEGAIVEVCESCAKKYGKIVSIPSAEILQKKVEKEEEEDDEELEIVENYGEIIREKRMSLGLTQEELAQKINEKKSLISKIENEEIVPDERVARKLEKFLNITLFFKPEKIVKTEETKTSKLTLGDVAKIK